MRDDWPWSERKKGKEEKRSSGEGSEQGGCETGWAWRCTLRAKRVGEKGGGGEDVDKR